MHGDHIADLRRILEREVQEFRAQRARIPQEIREVVMEHMQPQAAQAPDPELVRNPFPGPPVVDWNPFAVVPPPPRFAVVNPVWDEDDIGPG
jgi:hypothetical protein